MIAKKTEDKDFVIPRYTLTEEIINSIIHGIGVIFSIFALLLLFKKNSLDFVKTFCFSIYGGSLIILYLASTLYHSLKLNKAKKLFRVFDHCSIFVLIAGTYTPLIGLFLKAKIGLVILLVIWSVAILGIVLNAIDVNKFSLFSLICYIVMGWAAIFIIKPISSSLTQKQNLWLFIGGALYTLGTVLYMLGKRIKYCHCVWHLFVLCASVFHFLIFV
ncbi:MAG: hemolysin III family protein [Candidatus Improbicoccus pseudotrichonymphae]|uniref:Hemolysin III family protein n=1 Tax=Candidatus Improbicoccus pseudotrichonymphae TaxID=3033792 RepID=A0AA48I1K4_9FIRM|nr:MAG: hemolysin III family protein [Candidatus Improbicoccus pseudotrichonymphae]